MVPKTVPKCNFDFQSYTNYQNCPEICPQICPSELRRGSQYWKCALFLLYSGQFWGTFWGPFSGPFSGPFFPSESSSWEPPFSIYVQDRAKQILLSSVTHVPSGLMGCALAAYVSGQKEGGTIQTCRNFLARPCTQHWQKLDLKLAGSLCIVTLWAEAEHH